MSYYYLNRTLCDVLEEMRKLDNTKNYSSMLGLIEEAQSMANRMEAALSDIKDLRSIREDVKSTEKELKELKKERDQLKTIIDGLKKKSRQKSESDVKYFNMDAHI